MAQFHETHMGQKFFNSTIPRLIDSLNKISFELERANNLKEREIKLIEQKSVSEEYDKGKKI